MAFIFFFFISVLALAFYFIVCMSGVFLHLNEDLLKRFQITHAKTGDKIFNKVRRRMIAPQTNVSSFRIRPLLIVSDTACIIQTWPLSARSTARASQGLWRQPKKHPLILWHTQGSPYALLPLPIYLNRDDVPTKIFHVVRSIQDWLTVYEWKRKPAFYHPQRQPA